MADTVFNKLKTLLLSKNIDFRNGQDTFKVALLTSSYTPDQDNHAFFSDLTNEVSGAGYTAGGVTLANQAVSQDNTNNDGQFDADDASWASATITARYAALYKSTGTGSTSPLVQVWDFGSDKISTGGTFLIVFDARGLLNVL